jgi:molybdopterin-guanine dinucleotide biosynthesis protein A
MSEITAGILAGGRSKRIGQDKAILKFGELTLLERIYHQLRKNFSTIWILGKMRNCFNLPSNLFIEDIISNAGPIGGLLTVLKRTNKPTLITSCDTPFINEEHIQYLIDQFKPQYAATIAVSEKGLEPTFGIYQPQVIPIIEKLVAEKNLALYHIIDHLEVKFVDFNKAGYISDLFFNINTLSDYKKALYLKEENERIK